MRACIRNVTVCHGVSRRVKQFQSRSSSRPPTKGSLLQEQGIQGYVSHCNVLERTSIDGGSCTLTGVRASSLVCKSRSVKSVPATALGSWTLNQPKPQRVESHTWD